MYYTVYYHGTHPRFTHFQREVFADSKQSAVEKVYSELGLPYNTDDNGSIYDDNGILIADHTDETIRFGNGYFYADESVDDFDRWEMNQADNADNYIKEHK